MAKQKTTPAIGISTIGELVRRAEQNFIFGNNQVSKYVIESPYEDISKIEAYLNSKHTSGETDAMGREKPFFNIVLAARNIWFRATDLDRKNIRFKASNSKEVIPSLVANVILQNWMRKNNFGVFLNKWGLDLASYNSSVVKFIEQGGELHRMVIPWNRIICDFIDFDGNPKIEILELTPAQLKQREGYDQNLVDSLLDNLSSRETNGGERKDNQSNYIKLYEIHGNLPLSYLTGKEKDQSVYTQQMHVVTLQDNKAKSGFDDYTLYSGKEAEDPYMLTALMPSTDGSINLNGSVKTLFEAQWMQNHTVKLIKDQLDQASKLIYQTSDGNFVSQNALSSIENGDILIHAVNQPLTQVANNSHDIASLQNYGNQWKALAQEITSTPDVLAGRNMPSGTAFRQAAIIQQEALSNFEIMTENKGLALEDMMRKFVIPFVKKVALNNSDEITGILEDNDIAKIDSRYIDQEATKKTNNEIIERVIAGGSVLPEEQMMMQSANEMEMKSKLNETGKQRFFKPSEVSSKQWKELFEDFQWEVEVEITGEDSDKNTALTTLTTTLQTIAANPAILDNPVAKMLFNKILISSGIVSPIEIPESEPVQQIPNVQAGSVAVPGQVSN